MYKIGIIGFGFVGRAIAHGFTGVASIKIYDRYDNTYDCLDDVINLSDFLFVSVPTPVSDAGKQDLSYMDMAVGSIDTLAEKKKTVVFKSTLLPGTTRMYSLKYPNHTFIFCPEFLTEKNANFDFINTQRIVIGEENYSDDIHKLYRIRFSHTMIYHTSWESAEVLKYMCNCFFAVKLSFLNEMFDIAGDYLKMEYDYLRNMFLADNRIGNSHTSVPGPDGERGYGGKCIPKDIKSFILWAKENNIKLDMCEAADKVNERVRQNKDWLKIKGATTKNKF